MSDYYTPEELDAMPVGTQKVTGYDSFWLKQADGKWRFYAIEVAGLEPIEHGASSSEQLRNSLPRVPAVRETAISPLGVALPQWGSMFDAVKALHNPDVDEDYCTECKGEWPCPTVRAIEEAEE